MKKIRIPYSKLDLDRLVSTTLDFAREHFHPFFAIPWIEKESNYPTYSKETDEGVDYQNLPDEIDRDFETELEKGKILFFTFSTNDEYGSADCADGQNHKLWSEEDDQCDLSDVDSPIIQDTSCAGFLIEKETDTVSIRSAISSNDVCAMIQYEDDCRELDEAMAKFIRQYILD